MILNNLINTYKKVKLELVTQKWRYTEQHFLDCSMFVETLLSDLILQRSVSEFQETFNQYTTKQPKVVQAVMQEVLFVLSLDTVEQYEYAMDI